MTGLLSPPPVRGHNVIKPFSSNTMLEVSRFCATDVEIANGNLAVEPYAGGKAPSAVAAPI